MQSRGAPKRSARSLSLILGPEVLTEESGTRHGSAVGPPEEGSKLLTPHTSGGKELSALDTCTLKILKIIGQFQGGERASNAKDDAREKLALGEWASRLQGNQPKVVLITADSVEQKVTQQQAQGVRSNSMESEIAAVVRGIQETWKESIKGKQDSTIKRDIAPKIAPNESKRKLRSAGLPTTLETEKAVVESEPFDLLFLLSGFDWTTELIKAFDETGVDLSGGVLALRFEDHPREISFQKMIKLSPALQKFHNYIYGCSFNCATAHTPLSTLTISESESPYCTLARILEYSSYLVKQSELFWDFLKRKNVKELPLHNFIKTRPGSTDVNKYSEKASATVREFDGTKDNNTHKGQMVYSQLYSLFENQNGVDLFLFCLLERIETELSPNGSQSWVAVDSAKVSEYMSKSQDDITDWCSSTFGEFQLLCAHALSSSSRKSATRMEAGSNTPSFHQCNDLWRNHSLATAAGKSLLPLIQEVKEAPLLSIFRTITESCEEGVGTDLDDDKLCPFKPSLSWEFGYKKRNITLLRLCEALIQDKKLHTKTPIEETEWRFNEQLKRHVAAQVIGDALPRNQIIAAKFLQSMNVFLLVLYPRASLQKKTNNNWKRAKDLSLFSFNEWLNFKPLLDRTTPGGNVPQSLFTESSSEFGYYRMKSILVTPFPGLEVQCATYCLGAKYLVGPRVRADIQEAAHETQDPIPRRVWRTRIIKLFGVHTGIEPIVKNCNLMWMKFPSGEAIVVTKRIIDSQIERQSEDNKKFLVTYISRTGERYKITPDGAFWDFGKYNRKEAPSTLSSRWRINSAKDTHHEFFTSKNDSIDQEVFRKIGLDCTTIKETSSGRREIIFTNDPMHKAYRAEGTSSESSPPIFSTQIKPAGSFQSKAFYAKSNLPDASLLGPPAKAAEAVLNKRDEDTATVDKESINGEASKLACTESLRRLVNNTEFYFRDEKYCTLKAGCYSCEIERKGDRSSMSDREKQLTETNRIFMEDGSLIVISKQRQNTTIDFQLKNGFQASYSGNNKIWAGKPGAATKIQNTNISGSRGSNFDVEMVFDLYKSTIEFKTPTAYYNYKYEESHLNKEEVSNRKVGNPSNPAFKEKKDDKEQDLSFTLLQPSLMRLFVVHRSSLHAEEIIHASKVLQSFKECHEDPNYALFGPKKFKAPFDGCSSYVITSDEKYPHTDQQRQNKVQNFSEKHNFISSIRSFRQFVEFPMLDYVENQKFNSKQSPSWAQMQKNESGSNTKGGIDSDLSIYEQEKAIHLALTNKILNKAFDWHYGEADALHPFGALPGGVQCDARNLSQKATPFLNYAATEKCFDANDASNFLNDDDIKDAESERTFYSLTSGENSAFLDDTASVDAWLFHDDDANTKQDMKTKKSTNSKEALHPLVPSNAKERKARISHLSSFCTQKSLVEELRKSSQLLNDGNDFLRTFFEALPSSSERAIRPASHEIEAAAKGDLKKSKPTIPASIASTRSQKHPSDEEELLPQQELTATKELLGATESKAQSKLESKIRGHSRGATYFPIQVSPKILDLGSLEVGLTYCKTFQIRNMQKEGCRFLLSCETDKAKVYVSQDLRLVAPGLAYHAKIQITPKEVGAIHVFVRIKSEGQTQELPLIAEVMTAEAFQASNRAHLRRYGVSLQRCDILAEGKKDFGSMHDLRSRE